jgi:cytochrome c-type biogenesis protein CcmH
VKRRQILVLAGLTVLLVVAGLAVWRSTEDSGASAAERIASSLRCPACEGETVAQSRSPMAAAMREVIADQLATGHSPDQVRAWFAQRYGPAVLADPPHDGISTLLWILPGGVLLIGLVLAARTLRRRSAVRPPERRSVRVEPAWSNRTWDLVAVGVLAMVAAVAVAATWLGGDRSPPPVAATPEASTSRDAVDRQVTLARSLEQQGQYGAAADIYRAAISADPDPRLRLRLAFALVRAGQPAEASDIARQVLAGQPADPDALLVLGLAEREAKSPTAAETLRRFLRLAPDHPAAPEVRRLLSQRSR